MYWKLFSKITVDHMPAEGRANAAKESAALIKTALLRRTS